MIAHRAAWVDAKVLHRDISRGNILIDDEPDDPNVKATQGFLNDWDLSKYEEHLDKGAVHANRSVSMP